jgi:hypothetical protein
MDAVDRFLKFAAECEAMVKSSPGRENKIFWHSLAERWLLCAKLTEQLDTDLQLSGSGRRRKHAPTFAEIITRGQSSPT